MPEDDLFGAVAEENLKKRPRGDKHMVLVDFPASIIDFLEDSRVKYGFRSRNETIRFLLRRCMEMVSGSSQEDALEDPNERRKRSLDEVNRAIEEQNAAKWAAWPVHTPQNWVCPYCQSGKHCNGTDMTRPDPLARPGEERMIHWVCVCECGIKGGGQ